MKPAVSAGQNLAYTRRMRILKVSLPLIALAILSSLFLFSRSITMEGALPYAELDVADRLREPKMTDVQFATTSENGSQINIIARSVIPKSDTRAIAREAVGAITAPSGSITDIAAEQVDYDDVQSLAALTGGVEILSSGYTMTTQALDVDLARAEAESRSQVRAIGPLGQLDAGRMRVIQQGDGFVLVFKSGVRLLYTP